MKERGCKRALVGRYYLSKLPTLSEYKGGHCAAHTAMAIDTATRASTEYQLKSGHQGHVETRTAMARWTSKKGQDTTYNMYTCVKHED